MNLSTFKAIVSNRSLVFANNAAGGGDNSVDADAANVNPNNYLSPVIGGTKTFNVLITVIAVLVIVLLLLSIYKKISLPKIN